MNAIHAVIAKSARRCSSKEPSSTQFQSVAVSFNFTKQKLADTLKGWQAWQEHYSKSISSAFGQRICKSALISGI
jgi:hypothetical protein